MDKNKQGGM